MKIVLPVPPSANNAYFNLPRGGRAPSTELRSWRKEALAMVMLARPEPIAGPYAVTICLPDKLRGDIDNRIKPTLDLLVSAGVTGDDKWLRSVTARRVCDVEAGLMQVEVTLA